MDWYNEILQIFNENDRINKSIKYLTAPKLRMKLENSVIKNKFA
jgi:hypothetical protein